MTDEIRNVLAVAAATCKVGHVFLIDGVPYDWKASGSVSRSPERVYQYVTEQIEYYRPEFLITEHIGPKSRKKDVSRALVNAIVKAAQDGEVPCKRVERVQAYKNKYVEAQALVKRFPEMKPWVPKTRELWESEPRRTMIFEALSMALSVVDEDTEIKLETTKPSDA